MSCKKLTWGAACALMLAGCAGGERLTHEQQADTITIPSSIDWGSIFGPSPTRGRDPLDVRAPLYSIALTVLVDDTANSATEVYKHRGDLHGGGPNWTTYAHADQVRAGMQAFIERNGALVTGSEPLTCLIGEQVNRGDLDPAQMIYTKQGGVYSTCMGNPDMPDITGRPLRFAAPVEVAAAETLDLYTRLEVLNSGAVWGPASDPDAGVPGALKNVGSFWQGSGTVLSIIDQDAGAVFQGIGVMMSVAGSLLQTEQHGPHLVCTVTESLVPGFGDGQEQNDKPSPLFRVKLTGKQLWEATKNGDAALEYVLDWGHPAQSTLCNRPKTRLAVRIRRVVAEGTAGQPLSSRGSASIAPYPDQLDAFSIDGNRRLVHWQRLNKVWAPSGETLKTQRWAPGGGGIFGDGFWYDIFAPYSRLTAVTKGPGETDLFGVDGWGDLVGNWRNKDWDNYQWHDFGDISSGSQFPPGAPVAVIARDPNHLDLFAIAKDGSIMTAWWDLWSGWHAPFAITPANRYKPFDGTRGGGLAAVAPSPSVINVYAATVDSHIGGAYWTVQNGWNAAQDFAPEDWYMPGGEFAAVSRNARRIDFFYIDAFGHARTVWWDGNWTNTAQQVTPASLPAVPGGAIAVVPRKVDVTGDATADNDHMDVFTVGQDGHILHTSWRYGDDNFSWNANRTEKLNATAAPGAPISAVSPNPGSIQVVARKSDGTFTYTWYEDVERGNLYWQQVP